jgi:hypothetical protein
MNITRRVTIAAAATLTILAMTGCTPTAATSGSTPAEPAASATATPTAEPAAVETLGDSMTMVDSDGKPVTVTDKYGTYTRTTVNAAAAAMTVDPATIDTATLTAWSDEQILSAQQWTVRFIAEEYMDSEASDAKAGWEQWKADEASRLVDTALVDLDGRSDTGARSAVVFHTGKIDDSDGLVFVRDGGARATETSIDINKVNGFVHNGVNYITVDADASATLRISDETVVQGYVEANPGLTAEDIVEDYPKYGDGEINNETFTFDINYRIGATPDGSWKIVGFTNSTGTPFPSS